MGKWWTRIRNRFNEWNQAHQDRKDFAVLQGYPAYTRTYLTLYYNRSKRKWTFEWDDLFADPRPTHWPIEDCVMVVPRDTRATEDEINRAWGALNERGISCIKRGRK